MECRVYQGVRNTSHYTYLGVYIELSLSIECILDRADGVQSGKVYSKSELNNPPENTVSRGVSMNLSGGGGLKFFFQGGLATVGALKPSELNRFHWSRIGGLAPIAPPLNTSLTATLKSYRVVFIKCTYI